MISRKGNGTHTKHPDKDIATFTTSKPSTLSSKAPELSAPLAVDIENIQNPTELLRYRASMYEPTESGRVIREMVVKKILELYEHAVETENSDGIRSCISVMRELGFDNNEFSGSFERIAEQKPIHIRYSRMFKATANQSMSYIVTYSPTSGRLLLGGTPFTSRVRGKDVLHENLTAIDEIIDTSLNRKVIVLSLQSPTEVFQGTNPLVTDSIPAWGTASFKTGKLGEAKRIIFPIKDHTFISFFTGEIVTRKELLPVLNELHQKRTQGWDVLIHCAAGKSRSSTVTIAYLLEFQRMSLVQATNSVQADRTIVGSVHDRNPMQKIFLVSYFLEKLETDESYRNSLSSDEKLKNYTLCMELLKEAKEGCKSDPKMARYISDGTYAELAAKTTELLSTEPTNKESKEEEQNKAPVANDARPKLMEERGVNKKDSWLTRVNKKAAGKVSSVINRFGIYYSGSAPSERTERSINQSTMFGRSAYNANKKQRIADEEELIKASEQRPRTEGPKVG